MAIEVVQRVVRQHVAELDCCYEERLVTSPSLEGELVVHFGVDGTGETVSPAIASSTLGAEGLRDGGEGARALEACVATAVDRWTVPRPDAEMSVDTPLSFELAPRPGPAGDGFGGLGLEGTGRAGS